MLNEDQLAIFVMSHGRVDRDFTMRFIERAGWTGPLFVLIDDEDTQAGAYREKYGEQVVQFRKAEYDGVVDLGDNQPGRRSIVYARHACYDKARELGYRYFAQFDDDYNNFRWRFDADGYFDSYAKPISNLDAVMAALLDFYKSVPQCAALAMGQGGDFIGGGSNPVNCQAFVLSRKAMNSFICSVDRPIPFAGRLNDDVSAYTELQRRGVLFLTYMGVWLNQLEAATNPGGMTDVYQSSGWYKKAMHSVMRCPSAVFVQDMGPSKRRIHHRVRYDACFPKIVSEAARRER